MTDILHKGEAGNWMQQGTKCSTFIGYHTNGNDFMSLGSPKDKFVPNPRNLFCIFLPRH